MSVLLINPPYITQSAEAVTPPLGLAYIASYLRENDIEADIIDCTPLNLEVEDLERLIHKKNLDLVGITSTTPLIKKSIEVADAVKKTYPRVKTVLGGPHATALAKETLSSSDSLDIAVRGEGEITMLELANELEKRSPNLGKIRGITYKEKKNICTNEPRPLIEDLDELPFPARDLLPIGKYRPSVKWYFRMPFTTMMTSRGCPFRCLFCDSHLTFGRRTRFRSPQNVVDEIEDVTENYGVKELIFYDDTFTLNKKRVSEICDLLSEKNIDITWGCLSRVDTIDRRTLEKMKKVGCHMISFGIESGSEKMLKIIRKGITLKQAESAVELTKDMGLDSTGTFVLGIPGETHRTLGETINFAKKIDPTYAEFFRAIPFPGTDLYNNLVAERKLDDFAWEKYLEVDTMPLIKLDNFSSSELKQMSKKAYRDFYLRPSKILSYMLKMTSPHRVRGYYRAFKTFIGLLD